MLGDIFAKLIGILLQLFIYLFSFLLFIEKIQQAIILSLLLQSSLQLIVI